MQYWQLVITALGAVAAWLANEWRKREADNFARREDNYKSLLTAMASFYGGGSLDGRAEFLKQVQIGWLYCPDDVIRKAYSFLNTVHENFTGSQKEKEDAARALVLAIRQDMLPWYRKTELKAEEVQLLRVKHQGAQQAAAGDAPKARA
jgi:hypothetical protein